MGNYGIALPVAYLEVVSNHCYKIDMPTLMLCAKFLGIGLQLGPQTFNGWR
jgi:hypothetical protein